MLVRFEFPGTFVFLCIPLFLSCREKSTVLVHVLAYHHLGMYSCGRPLRFLSLRARSTSNIQPFIRVLMSLVKGLKVRHRDPVRLKWPSRFLSAHKRRSSGTVTFRKAVISRSWWTRSRRRCSQCTTSKRLENCSQARA